MYYSGYSGYSGTVVVEDYHTIAYTYAMQQQQEKKRQWRQNRYLTKQQSAT